MLLAKQKQYYVKNKDVLLEYQKQYKLDNKEKLKQQYSEKMYCQPCGLYHRRGNKAQHYNTQKHLDNLKKCKMYNSHLHQDLM